VSAVASHGVEVLGDLGGRRGNVLTVDALAFVAELQRRFGPTRIELLERRVARRRQLAEGGTLGLLPETQSVRDGNWRVVPPSPALTDRRVEITGPTERKMMINALNSGARGFMADCEDALSPTWDNIVDGQINLYDAVRGKIELVAPDGREYRLAPDPATLLVRPRGWHLVEKHVLVDGIPVSGALFDFGVFVFHNAAEAAFRRAGPFFYLPKTESHREARLWNEVFGYAEDALGLARSTMRATVLIETVPAVFEMDEILYEMRDHSAGLNAGRWDYIFSMIKTFRERPEFLLPDRADVRMTVPFMRAYTELLVKTCHRRGAHAMGGMAALIPSRRDSDANARALAAVRDDKRREAAAGFDGTWVAHPDVVAVATEEFDAVLGDRPHQLDRARDDISVGAVELLDVAATPGVRTEAGLRNNIDVGIRYLSSWLNGNGAAGIHGLMEDAATAEIARSQVWQWVRHAAALDDGTVVTEELVRDLIGQELARIGAAAHPRAAGLFEEVALGEQLAEFLTLVAYDDLS
jgi:malate synthase